MTPDELAEVRDDLHYWIDSGHPARDNLDRLLEEVERLRNFTATQGAAIDQFMARIEHALLELGADDDG